MRKILWTVLLLCLYIWAVTSGRDGLFLERGKMLYQALVSWFDDAQVDFHTKRLTPQKKKSRRWD